MEPMTVEYPSTTWRSQRTRAVAVVAIVERVGIMVVREPAPLEEVKSPSTLKVLPSVNLVRVPTLVEMPTPLKTASGRVVAVAATVIGRKGMGAFSSVEAAMEIVHRVARGVVVIVELAMGEERIPVAATTEKGHRVVRGILDVALEATVGRSLRSLRGRNQRGRNPICVRLSGGDLLAFGRSPHHKQRAALTPEVIC